MMHSKSETDMSDEDIFTFSFLIISERTTALICKKNLLRVRKYAYDA